MWILLFILIGFYLGSAGELSLKEAIETALKNSHMIKSASREVKAQELELKAAQGALFPRLKLEETYTRTDIPVYAFMTRLNQERISMQDFDPAKLNNPSAINNFETKLTLEVPIWLGGKLQSMRSMASYEYKAVSMSAKRSEEEVIKEVYKAYADAVLAKESIKVSEQAVKDAQEHVRLAESMYRTGMALLSDVLRAKVYLSKVEENLQKAERGYKLAKKALETVMGKSLGDFEVQELNMCPSVGQINLEEAIRERKDIRAMEERIKGLKESYKFVLSDNLPHIYAFAQYSLNSKNYPFGADGGGYMFGVGLTWSFDTGLSTLRRAQANLERKASLEERLKFMKDMALLEARKAFTEYENSQDMLRSAQDRVKTSKEVLRVMETRYRNGLARMVDILDAQTELDKARLERLQAINACHKAYAELLYALGRLEEVLK